MEIKNFLLTSRENPSSTMEAVADQLLTPARVLLGGKREVVVFHDDTVHMVGEISHLDGWKKAALKVAALLVFIPLSILGTLLKLFCCLDVNYRAFCSEKLSDLGEADPALFEIHRKVYAEDRLSDPRKVQFENAFVDRLALSFKKEEPLCLLSLGGKESHEQILRKLKLAGFKEITVDDSIQDHDYAGLLVIQSPIFDNKSCKQYKSAIDLTQALGCLKEKGVWALESDQGRALLGPSMHPIFFDDKMSLLQQGAADLVNRLPNQQQLRGAFPYFSQDRSTALLFLFFLAIALKQSGKAYENITIAVDNPEEGYLNSVIDFEALLENLFDPNIRIEILQKRENKNSQQSGFIRLAIKGDLPNRGKADFLFALSSKRLDLLKEHFDCLGASSVLLSGSCTNRDEILGVEMQNLFSEAGEAFAERFSY